VAAVAIAYLVQTPLEPQVPGGGLPSFLLGVISTTLTFGLIAGRRALGARCLVALAPLASSADTISGKKDTAARREQNCLWHGQQFGAGRCLAQHEVWRNSSIVNAGPSGGIR